MANVWQDDDTGDYTLICTQEEFDSLCVTTVDIKYGVRREWDYWKTYVPLYERLHIMPKVVCIIEDGGEQ